MRADARPRMQALQVWLGIPRSRALISWALCQDSPKTTGSSWTSRPRSVPIGCR